jgi:UDP-N-acetylmuramoyl-L-alanyl-D-glutamate--2,6-diaminopimelate ligase
MNLENALAASTTLAALGFSLSKIAEALPGISGVPGRMEFIAREPFGVVVDYAHNPSSFRALYETVKLIPHERIIHVFGATGGGRDKAKRAEMGEIAARNAGVVIVTTDDSYDEDPGEITRAVIAGAAAGTDVRVILDRREAIRAAITEARPRDLVLITGKGCEQVQIIGSKRLPWDDRTVAREALESKSKR